MFSLGSLFDGSGGFPLAGTLCGIDPIWASEIEPYPIAVTRSRFPNMKHIGDVSKVNGAEIEPVDVITFGSPCQDLSVAGKRAGLKHEDNGDEETTRSGLFMEAVRIIKEMRKATNGIYPRFALWENVPGAFSSNKGEDFRIVLEELIKVIEPQAPSLPLPQEGWPYADCYMGDKWSIAYRTLDAQYWGVPQRRRRIYLVADFGGQSAGEILFKREGLQGHFETGRTPWKRTSANAERGADTDDREVYNESGRGYWMHGFGCLRAEGENRPSRPSMCIVQASGFKAGQSAQARSIGWEMEKTPTLAAEAGGNSIPSVCVKEKYLFENHSADSRYTGPLDVCQTLPARLGTGGNNTPFVVEKKVYESHPTDGERRIFSMQGFGDYKESDVSSGLNARDYKSATDLVVNCMPVYCLQGNGIDRADTAGCNGKGWKEDVSYTLNTIDRPAVAYGVDCRNMNEYPGLYPTLQAKPNGGQSLNFSGAVHIRHIVRRLTPTECARLQGFPDKWGHPDYKGDLTDEEHQFWQEVRNTHATVNGRATKEYTKAQILTWYNKLHTDSAEYKMWGNGIALPTALYVMQGIADALNINEFCKAER